MSSSKDKEIWKSSWNKLKKKRNWYRINTKSYFMHQLHTNLKIKYKDNLSQEK